MDGSDTSRSLPFLKMHGLGNDFVVIDARRAPDPMTPALARLIGDRRQGVGFDQLVVLTRDDSADARIVFWNSDGTKAAACGNATRCVAELVMDETGQDRAALLSDFDLLLCRRNPDGLITVDMGEAQFDWTDIPLAEPAETISLPLEGAPGAVSIGNPHCVFFVEDAEAVALEQVGPEWERHPMFPNRTNVEFVQVIDRAHVRCRVWERGAGVTLACGSGACAVVVAGARKGLLDNRATVTLDGGPLQIEWTESGRVLMTGPTSRVFSGTFDSSFLDQAR